MRNLLHESLHRGEACMARLAQTHIVVCGAGALGANLAENLVRCGARLVSVIDKDRIEEHNLSTQPYGRSEVGSPKAKILANNLYRWVGVQVQAAAAELNRDNIHKLLKPAQLVVDCFDNTLSRKLVQEWCHQHDVPCLHAGMSSDYAEVLWNDGYRVPNETAPDRCDYPLARTLVVLTAAIAAETVLRYLDCGETQNRTLTLADLKIEPYS